MKLSTLFFSAAISAGMIATASAQGWYASILGGETQYPRISYDGGRAPLRNGINVGGRMGYDVDEWSPIPGFSLEADIFYNKTHLQTNTGARYDSVSGMGNLIYHLNMDWPVTVYGGAGAGAVRTEVDDPLSNRNSTVFGWQALGGLDYRFAPYMTLFAEYRYQNAHNANLGFIGGPVGNTSDNASVGFKFDLSR